MWEKESITGVQCWQENHNSRVPCASGKLGKPRFPLKRWTLGLGFSCPHWWILFALFMEKLYMLLSSVHETAEFRDHLWHIFIWWWITNILLLGSCDHMIYCKWISLVMMLHTASFYECGSKLLTLPIQDWRLIKPVRFTPLNIRQKELPPSWINISQSALQHHMLISNKSW